MDRTSFVTKPTQTYLSLGALFKIRTGTNFQGISGIKKQKGKELIIPLLSL